MNQCAPSGEDACAELFSYISLSSSRRNFHFGRLLAFLSSHLMNNLLLVEKCVRNGKFGNLNTNQNRSTRTSCKQRNEDGGEKNIHFLMIKAKLQTFSRAFYLRHWSRIFSRCSLLCASLRCTIRVCCLCVCVCGSHPSCCSVWFALVNLYESYSARDAVCFISHRYISFRFWRHNSFFGNWEPCAAHNSRLVCATVPELLLSHCTINGDLSLFGAADAQAHKSRRRK